MADYISEDDFTKPSEGYVPENEFTGIRPKVKEPGYIDTALTGVVQGGIGMLSGAGAAAEWAGDVTDSVGIRNAGKAMQATADRAMELPVAKVEGPSFEGTFMENPNAKKAVNIVGQALPSLAAAMATGGGTALGLRSLGMAAPKALATGSAVAAGGLGLIEGAPQYVEAKEAGKSKGEASAIGAAATIGTAALEYLGLSSLLKMAGKGIVKGAGKGIVTEGLQEGTQQFWQNLVAKVGYDKSKSLFEGMAEAVIGGSGAGGIVGAVTGRETALKDRATEQMLTKVLKAPTTVDNGIATAQTANGIIKAPVDIIAQVVAAGVTPDELATASSEIERGVTEVTKKTKINRLPDDPNLPGAVIYNVKGKEYAYAPKEGMSREDLVAGLEGKSPGMAFNWLKKNSVQVKLGEENAPTTESQAEIPNEPVQAVQPGPQQVVDGVPTTLRGETNAETQIPPEAAAETSSPASGEVGGPDLAEAGAGDARLLESYRPANNAPLGVGSTLTPEREQQILNEEINDAINIPRPSGVGNVPSAVTRDIGEAVAAEGAESSGVSLDGTTTQQRVVDTGTGLVQENLGRNSQNVGEGVVVPPKRYLTPRPLGKGKVLDESLPPVEVVTPSEDTPMGVNREGESLYEQANGTRYRIRNDRKDRPDGYPDFGGDLAPVENVVQTSSDTKNISKNDIKSVETRSVSQSGPSKKQPKIPKAFVKIAKDIDIIIKEDGVSDDFKRVPSFEAIAAYREKYPDDSPETAMSELAWMPEAEYAALTAVEDEALFSQTPATGTTTQQVEQELKDFLGQGFANLVRKGKLEVVQGVEQLPEAGVPLYTKTRKIAGVYLASKKKVVLVADNIKPEDARYVMLHEGTHALLREDKVFVKKKERILSDFERLAKTVPAVQAAMAKVPSNTPAAVKVEEGLAYFLQDKANHKHSLFKRVISAIKAALYRLGIAPGRLTASDMTALFTQGTQAWARQGEMSVSEFAQDALLSVKDAGRKIQNLPAFKKWFAGSKVVDSEGRPLVVYHGTPSGGFSSFDTDRAGTNIDSGFLGAGVYLTNSTKAADYYANTGGQQAPAVYPLYAVLKNPFVWGKKTQGIRGLVFRGESLPGNLTERVIAEADVDFDVAKAIAGDYFNNIDPYLEADLSSALTRVLKSMGHDGVIATENSGLSEYVAFSPTQIKSIFNDKWDGNNPDILFSRIDDTLKAGQKKLDTAVQALKNPKSKLHDLYVQYAPQWLSVTPLHTLAQTFGKTIPQIRQFAKHLDAVVASKTEIVDTSAVLYEQAEKLAEAGVGLDVFNTAAATASFNRITPWADMYDQAWVPETGTKSDRLKAAQQKWVASKMQQATGMSYTQAYEQARKAYEALKTEDLKQAYIKVVEHIASVRIRERNNLLAYIEAVSEQGTELRANLMAQFEASFSNLHGAYWPLSRVGDFRMEYTDTEGFRTVKHYTTLAERREDKAAILAEGVDPETIKEDYKDKQPRGSVAIPQMLMGQLAEAVEKKALEGVDLDNEEAVTTAQERAQAITDDMNQIWLRWQPETSALKNSVRRKNVKGFSKEMLRSYLDYMQRHASNIAWTEQGKKIEQDIKSLSDDINEQKKEDGMVDVTMQRHILNDLRNRIQALRSVSVGPVASVLGKLGTAYYMTSPSIALVQMSQLGVLTLPKLSTMFGAGKATTALAKGTRDAFKKDFTRDPMFADPVVNTVYKNMREVVTDENRNVPQARGKELGERLFTDDQILNQMKSFTPYQMQLLTLREAMARNLLDISAAHEAYELTRGKDPKSLWNRAFKFAMLPMSLSELASRKATVLATYELARQEGQDFFGAMNTIAEVVNDTLYSYSKENKGSAMQGGLSRVVLQFQHYRIMTGIRLAMLFRNAVKGESAEVKTAATKELVGVMGMSAALAGTMGLPLSGLVFTIMNLLLGDDDEPIDSELMYTNWLRETLGETLGDVAASGLPTLAGADLSGRIGLSGIYGMQNEPPSGLHGRNLAAWWAASQLGPIFSVGQGWFQGYDEIVNKGNYLKGLEAATPKPIKDGLKALRIGTDGLKDGQGKRLLADEAINADEIILVALGFNADEIAKAQSASRSLNKLSTKISERRGKLIRQAAQAFVEGDDASPALEKIRSFNRSMPAFAITGGDIRPAIRKILVGDLGTTGPRESLVAGQYEVPDYVRE